MPDLALLPTAAEPVLRRAVDASRPVGAEVGARATSVGVDERRGSPHSACGGRLGVAGVAGGLELLGQLGAAGSHDAALAQH